MTNGHICEHTEEYAGACHRCRFPMKPRAVKFIGSMREWMLLYRQQILQRRRSLLDIVEITKSIADNEERNFMIMCPNGLKISVELSRSI